jgi:hypothetical protein
MKRYELQDGAERLVRFTGDHLTHVTSDDGERLRWLDLDIYRTQAGKYIVHQVGRTSVYHALDSECTPKAFEQVKVLNLRDDVEPCPVCLSQGDDLDLSEVRMESDLYRVVIHNTARNLVDALENTNAEGRRYYSKIVRNALIAASEHDEQIRDAFLVIEVA